MARRNAHFRRRFNASGPLERVLILIVLAVAIGVTIGLLLPQVSSDVAKITGGYTATGSAADTLNQIGVKDKYQLTVTSQEKDAMLAVLHTCPGQAVPADE